eukprot:1145652-Pelagomonas_calceolata.AAC.1
MTGSWLPTCAGTCAGLLYNNGWVAGCPLVQVTRAVLLYNMGTKVQGLQSKQLTASLQGPPAPWRAMCPLIFGKNNTICSVQSGCAHGSVLCPYSCTSTSCGTAVTKVTRGRPTARD